MRSLLSARDQRIVSLLEILTQREWVSLKTMTEYLDCSEKTIRNDLGLISNEFAEVVIESSPQRGYRLIKNEFFPIEHTINHIISNTMIYQLLTILLKDSNLKLLELESILFVSATSLRNTMKDFNAKLKNDDVFIRNKPFRIEGNEVKITGLFCVKVYQSYFNRSCEVDGVFTFIGKLVSQLGEYSPELKRLYQKDRHFVLILAYVRVYREVNGHHYQRPEGKEIQIEDILDDYELGNEFRKHFKQGISSRLLKNLVGFILYEISTTSYVEMLYLFQGTAEFKTVNQRLKASLNQMADKFGLAPYDNQKISQLLSPTIAADRRNEIDYNIHLAIVHLLVYEHQKIVTETKEYRYERFFFNSIILEVAHLLQVNDPAFVERIVTISQKMEVAFLTVDDQRHNELLHKYFTYHFKHIMNFHDIVSFDRVDSYDLLITNTFDYHKSPVPILNISGLPTEKNNAKVISFFREYLLTNYLTYKDNEEAR